MLFEDAHLIAVADVARRFRGYVERDDLVQEGAIWLLEHRKRVLSYVEDENEKRGRYRLLRDLTMHMEKYARAQKAQTLGYSADDEAFYSKALVGMILPSVLHEDYDQPQVEASEIRGNNDPAESGVWLAHRADVVRAWEEASLTDKEREALILHFGFGFSSRVIEDQIGIDHVTATRRVDSGLRKMIAHIGGDKPQGCPYNCECHEGRLRVRPGIHSEISGKNQELR